jgi:hypothetical protein
MTSGEPSCPRCDGTNVEEGFLDDKFNGRVRWLAGPLEIEMFGNARRLGRRAMVVYAARCTTCSSLELTAIDG